MKIVITGLPGSGKSTVGEILAKGLHYEFCDLDAKIQEVTGLTIADLFVQQGEDIFRRIETNTLLKLLLTEGDRVIALGGGAMAYGDNAAFCTKHATCVWLDTPIDRICERIDNIQERPMLSKGDLKSQLENLYAKREIYYKMSQIKIDVGNLGAKFVAKKIAKIIKQQ